MHGLLQKEISQKIGISEQTISKWVEQGSWATIRAGVQITRPELVNKALCAVNKLLDQIYESQDIELTSKLPDQLAKFASFIHKLDNEANVVSAIDVFIAFSKWIRHRASYDKEVTPELIAAMEKYHDLYIKDSL
jgi:DNA-binding XRE family transcriptional regulator